MNAPLILEHLQRDFAVVFLICAAGLIAAAHAEWQRIRRDRRRSYPRRTIVEAQRRRAVVGKHIIPRLARPSGEQQPAE